MFITTQTLEYGQHKEELELIAIVLEMLSKGDIAAAKRSLVIRHDALIMAQEPRLKPYNQNEERVR